MSISQWTQHLWERFTSDPDGCISLAQPLGYSPEVKTTWQVGISGVKLSDLIDESNYETFMYEIVKGLAGLHGSDYRVSRQTGAYDWLERIRTGMTALIRAYPKYEATLVSIVSRLEKIAPYLSPMPDHLIHGDFHMDQLLISDDQIVFFDFDDLAMGDPMQDLAKFMVELHFQDIDPGLVKLMSMSFFHAYQSQAKWEVPMDRLTWHIELQCLKKASRLFLEEGAGLRDIIHTTELARNIILEVSNVRQKP
jgi:aminoglycoside phosphotransferase (APT) family kinase protein